MHSATNKVVLITARCSLSDSNCASGRRSSVAKSAHQMHRTSASMHICRFNHLKANVMQVGSRPATVSAAQSVKQWLMGRCANALSWLRLVYKTSLLLAVLATKWCTVVSTAIKRSVFRDWRRTHTQRLNTYLPTRSYSDLSSCLSSCLGYAYVSVGRV